MGSDPLLKPKHKIFLSHSGAQKEFVDHLCKALEDRFHYPFFDRRHESLPKGEQFPELIVQAAKQCEMLIVVVSDDYFMSKWPMIELSAFVQAHKQYKLHRESKSSTKGPKILPLFYGLSVSALDDATLQKKWFAEWESLAKADPRNRIIVSDWKYALDVLKSFNGLLYDRHLKEIVAFEEKVVSYVCKSFSPDIKKDDSHVQGKSNICEVFSEKIGRLGVSKKYNVKVLGLYGVGGIGKTTTCKILCNELSNEYEGRVCDIEFSSVSSIDSKKFYQKVLQGLTRKSMDVIQPLSEEECKDVLRKTLFQHKTFLAIDNVSDSHQSIELAKTFLNLPYHMESLVVVTARSQSVLELLGIKGDAYLEMPDLGEVDAMKLFLHHAVGGKEFFAIEEKDDIMTCVRRCYFSKGHGQGHHYHPLALRSLGLQLGCLGENPSSWVKHLPRVKAFNYLPGGNPVFDILRSGFDLLPKEDQTLFMDVGCFLCNMSFDRFVKLWCCMRSDNLLSVLCIVHEEDEESIITRLELLKRKGLLEHLDLKSNQVTMHDLYLEFIELESKGSFNKSTNLSERMWMNIVDGDLTKLKYQPQGGCWHKLIRLRINFSALYGGSGGRIGSLKGIKWKYFANVGVLQLHGVHLEHGALNLAGLVCVRILKLHGVRDVKEIVGLGELENLTNFEWYYENLQCRVQVCIVGQFSSSLKLLNIFGWIVLVPDALVQCNNLVELTLRGVEVLSLNLDNCWSLESVDLCEIKKLHSLFGLATCQPSCLQSLRVTCCKDLVDIPGMDHLICLKELRIDFYLESEVPNLLALTKLQVLRLYGNVNLATSVECSIPPQLQELCWSLNKASERLNLNGFNQLEFLNLSYSYRLTSLAELGDLPALQSLHLYKCECLELLPNLSKSRNLKQLTLRGCLALILHERDIQMLSELPLLQPMDFRVEEYGEHGKRYFSLDLHRRKIITYQVVFSFMYEQEERDLGPPPIDIKNLNLKMEMEYSMGLEDSESSDSSDY